jgi:hypothetical protein
LRILAIAVAVHGLVFAIGSVTIARAENPAFELLGEIYFFAVLAPAMMLAKPFAPVLWHFHLMQAPGWFAWPKPAGFTLVYISWILALLAVSLLAQRPKR